MRTITKEYNVYRYAELSEDAKDVVRKWYLDGQSDLSFIFTEDCLYRLKELFPYSELEVQYSFGYCQGDGLNIYGDIYLDEVLDKISNSFTEKELKFFRWVFNTFGSSYKMPSNNRYCYCICSRNDFMEDISSELKYYYYRSIPTETIERFNELVGEYLDNLCGEFEKDGYAFFYEVSEEDLEEHCEANDYEFTINGKLFI